MPKGSRLPAGVTEAMLLSRRYRLGRWMVRSTERTDGRGDLDDWASIDWSAVERTVRRLQERIFRASQRWQMLEPYAGRLARTVLRELGEQKCSPSYPTPGSNRLRAPEDRQVAADASSVR